MMDGSCYFFFAGAFFFACDATGFEAAFGAAFGAAFAATFFVIVFFAAAIETS